jgi:hypothetical protein
MARFALTSTVRASKSNGVSPDTVVTHVVDQSTTGDVYLAFDNTKVTSASDLRMIVDGLVKRAVGYGGLKP